MSETTQNICYTLHTKDSVTQSLRTKGALNSLRKIENFLDYNAVNISVESPSIELHLFGLSWKERKAAKQTYKELSLIYGKPTSAYSSFKITRLFWGMHETNSWEIKPSDLAVTLEFIDTLEPVVGWGSQSYPYVTAIFNFWLKHPSVDTRDKSMQSDMMVFLSQRSNTGALHLVMPYANNDRDFVNFRKTLQEKCPSDLKDKYFYVRKYNKAGAAFYRRLYPSE